MEHRRIETQENRTQEISHWHTWKRVEGLGCRGEGTSSSVAYLGKALELSERVQHEVWPFDGKRRKAPEHLRLSHGKSMC